MHAFATFVSLGAVAATLFTSVSAFTGTRHEIIDLKLHNKAPTLGSTGRYSLSFQLHDPDPLTDTYTECSAHWKNSVGPPSDYVDCNDDSYGFRIKKFANSAHFTIETKHTFEDPSVGDPPQDQTTTFARGRITPKNTQCTAMLGATNCHETKTPIKLKIYAAIA